MSDSDATVSIVGSMDDAPDNGLMIQGPPFGLERVYDYEPGGHHPVHLDEILHGRYRIIHKLGTGGYANVWLCLDVLAESSRYVAVKIIMAERSVEGCSELRVNKLIELGVGEGPSSKNFCLALDQFGIEGPNGVHYAFVYPVLGPRVSRLLNLTALDDMGPPLREIALQATQAMATLHVNGICHGDFRPANILAHISGLDGLDEREVLQILGKPEKTDVVNDSGGAHELTTAPRYLVYPIDWDKVISSPSNTQLVSQEACVIDFGESFDITAPPEELGILQIYCAPEYCLEGAVGINSDLWALGCTLFEIRTGRKLFDTFDDDLDEYLCKVAVTLGKFPEPWWSSTWQARKGYFEDEVDENGLVVEASRGPSAGAVHNPNEPHVVISEQAEPRSLQEALSLGLFYEHRDRPGGIQRAIPEEEIRLLSELLLSLLQYNPADRLQASRVSGHAWFKLI